MASSAVLRSACRALRRPLLQRLSPSPTGNAGQRRLLWHYCPIDRETLHLYMGQEKGVAEGAMLRNLGQESHTMERNADVLERIALNNEKLGDSLERQETLLEKIIEAQETTEREREARCMRHFLRGCILVGLGVYAGRHWGGKKDES
ncbi:hypothetical protein ACP4OV_002313 [Aristida adscensionis]